MPEKIVAVCTMNDGFAWALFNRRVSSLHYINRRIELSITEYRNIVQVE
jgi:hypothetical protein